jgi:hypothetical protein
MSDQRPLDVGKMAFAIVVLKVVAILPVVFRFFVEQLLLVK